MNENEKKDRYDIEYEKFQGRHFKRVFRGHIFTDEECRALSEGKEIEVKDLVSKAGKRYGVRGKLSEQSFKNDEGEIVNFLGFEQTGFLDNGVPDSFCGHTSTEEEKETLTSGEMLHLDGLVGKKGKPFSADVSYGEKDGGKGIILTFPEN